MLPLCNPDGGIHRADHVVAKHPYKEGTFNIEIMENVLQWEPGATMLHHNQPCNEGCYKGRALYTCILYWLVLVINHRLIEVILDKDIYHYLAKMDKEMLDFSIFYSKILI